MPTASAENASEAKRRTFRELIIYFALTFAITFGLGAGYIFFPRQFQAVVGSLNSPQTSWLFYLAVCAPTISALLVSFAFGGWSSVKTLFAGLVRRFQIRWLFIALLTIPAGGLVWALVERVLVGGVPRAIDVHALVISAPLLWLTTPQLILDPGPWGEETGWRGFALPRLLTRLSALSAALILGVVWGLWHTPAFFVSGLAQSGLNYAWFLVGTVSLSVFMTWIYVNANCNYLVAGVIPHAVFNNLPSAHVYSEFKIQVLLCAVIAMLLVIVFGPSLRGWGSRQVVPAKARN